MPGTVVHAIETVLVLHITDRLHILPIQINISDLLDVLALKGHAIADKLCKMQQVCGVLNAIRVLIGSLAVQCKFNLAGLVPQLIHGHVVELPKLLILRRQQFGKHVLDLALLQRLSVAELPLMDLLAVRDVLPDHNIRQFFLQQRLFLLHVLIIHYVVEQNWDECVHIVVVRQNIENFDVGIAEDDGILRRVFLDQLRDAFKHLLVLFGKFEALQCRDVRAVRLVISGFFFSTPPRIGADNLLRHAGDRQYNTTNDGNAPDSQLNPGIHTAEGKHRCQHRRDCDHRAEVRDAAGAGRHNTGVHRSQRRTEQPEHSLCLTVLSLTANPCTIADQLQNCQQQNHNVELPLYRLPNVCAAVEIMQEVTVAGVCPAAKNKGRRPRKQQQKDAARREHHAAAADLALYAEI